jgi:hypothetical protein
MDMELSVRPTLDPIIEVHGDDVVDHRGDYTFIEEAIFIIYAN